MSVKKRDHENNMVATVSAIIERQIEGEVAIYLQTRCKPSMRSSGTLEIPGGRIRVGEDVYTALQREVLEETGLAITKIKPESSTIAVGKFGHRCYAFTPFCGNMHDRSHTIGFVFICEAEGEPKMQSSEAEDPRWVPLTELKKMIDKDPTCFFYYYLGALTYYIDQKEKGLI